MRRLLPPALVAVAAFVVFANTLSHQFVYDDRPVVVENPRVHHLANWREILTSPWWPRGLYRPVTSLTLAANWTLDPGDPSGFHLVNVLLHALAAALLCVLGVRLMGVRGALAAGLVFAVHPVHVEAVANVVGRAEVLAALFALAASLLYLRYGDPAMKEGTAVQPRWLLPVGAVVVAALALASKESAFALPGILLVVDWARARATGEEFPARFRRTRGLWLAILALSLGWLGLRSAILGDLAGDVPAPGLAGTTPWERLVIMLPVVPEYLRLLLFPARLSAEYSPDFLPVTRTFGLRAMTGLALLGGCVALGVSLRRRAPMVGAGLAWTGAAIVVIGNVLVPSGLLLAERTLYLASAGLCLSLGWLWARLYDRSMGAAVTALALVVMLGAARTYSRAGVWKDNATFFRQLVIDAPGSYRADWVAAMHSYMAGDSLNGERLMRRGLGTYGGNPAMWSDFAMVTERQRRWSEAARYFWMAFVVDPSRGSDAARAVANRVQAGQLDTAGVLLDAAQRVLPGSPDLEISESHLALAGGDAQRSLVLRRRAAVRNPGDWRYWQLTAEAALKARECGALREALGKLESVRPGPPRAAILLDSARAMCDGR